MQRGLITAFSSALLVVLASAPAWALDEIYSPHVEPGELSVEYSGSRTFDGHSDKNNAQQHEAVMEYGMNNHWEVEGSIGFEKQPQKDVQVNHIELENRFQFFEQGQNWVDSGLLVAFDEATHHADANSFEVKLLLEKDIGHFTSRANIGFTQEVGPNAAGGPDYVFLWSTRYRYDETLQPGLEVQSDLGADQTLRHFNQQDHYIGPALYGRLFSHLKYETAYLFGVSDAASKSAARALLEYEMHF